MSDAGWLGWLGARDSPRWCGSCDRYGDHHTDRCPGGPERRGAAVSAATDHICSQTTCRCPSCGHEDSRDAFEGWEGDKAEWVVRCRKCETEHPDQSNWDDRDCVACEDEGRYA